MQVPLLTRVGDLRFATSVHLAVAGAPAAVTAGADTPLFVNAGPAGPSPANFESTSPVEIDQRPEWRGIRGSAGGFRHRGWLAGRERLADRATQV